MARKKCIACTRLLDVRSFYRHPGTRDRRENRCKKCRLALTTENRSAKPLLYKKLKLRWNRLNQDKNNEYQRNLYTEYKAWFDSLKNKPCTDCKISYPAYVMDWDHVRGKKLFSVSAALVSRKKTSKQRILSEIKKCELVCSNCHRVRTHTRLCATRVKSRYQKFKDF